MTELEKQLAIIISHDSECGGIYSVDLYGQEDCDCNLNKKVKKIMELIDSLECQGCYSCSKKEMVK